MDSTEKIILSGSLNKSSKNENMSLNVNFSGNKKLLPEDGIEDVVNLYEEYLKERKISNKFRLIVNINPFCSNVLFNPFTEIVKYDETGTTLLNFTKMSDVDIDGTIGKDSAFTWTAYDAIRDTQLSNDRCGFTYYCGLDIFNNHILRNKTFKSVNYSDLSENEITSYEEVYGEVGYKDDFVQGVNNLSYSYVRSEDFNTIDDYMRDSNGVIVSENRLWAIKNSEGLSPEKKVPLHLYQKPDVYSFEDCVKEKLIERNGWFGFSNPSVLNTISSKVTGENESISSVYFDVEPNDVSVVDCETGEQSVDKLDITLESMLGGEGTATQMNLNKAVNNKKYCDFVDMYPSRELYSFSPLYNERKKRYEKNWNYCLTYPSRSITKQFNGDNFPFFEELEDKTIALKVVTFDEFTVGDDGRSLLTIYSICQHGLKEGDSVNIYVTNDGESKLFYNNGKVVKIIDKYIFQVYKDSANMSKRWLKVDEIEDWDEPITIFNEDGTTSEITCTYDRENGFVNIDNNYYKVAASKRCNIDPKAQNVSFKRVFNNVECEYYVRVFSRLPNFKFADAEINDFNLYQNNSLDLINRYSDPKTGLNDFENHISDMSFAQTSYGDNDTEIVFTDDIDVSFLKDNLGRPLSEIYLTIVKNNKGYEKWYRDNEFNDDSIEFSHCFGRNSSSFLFNDYYRNVPSDVSFLNDVRDICAGNQRGLKYEDGDEVKFDETRDYYGDIAYYCQVECDEYSLGSVMCRFNTVQREIADYSEFNGGIFNSLSEDILSGKIGVMFHDEIIDDESGGMASKPGYICGIDNLYLAFDETKHKQCGGFPPAVLNLYHSSYHLKNSDEKNKYKLRDMTSFKEGYYYKMHYKIPLKTVSMSISSDKGITYDLFSIEPIDGDVKVKTVYENDLTLNDKLTLYDKTNNKFYYLTVTDIYTKFYFKCSVKNEDLTEGFNGDIELGEVVLVKRSTYTPEYAKLIKDGSCTYYWRNIVANGIEQDDSKTYPFTNGAFYINRQINFFLRRQDPQKEYLGMTNADFDYTPDGELLPLEYYENQYYDSEEIETC
jgi:hypothetical protein